MRRGDRAHAVGDARAGGERGDARLARDLRPALGGERGRLLVAHVDEVDALLAAAVVDREEVPAGQREELGDAVRLEPLGDQPAAVDLRLFGLGGSRPSGARAAVRASTTSARRASTGAQSRTVSDLPFSSTVPRGSHVHAALGEQAARRLGDQHVVAGLARDLLDARGGVDGVADHGELDAPAAADGAGDDRARS